MIDVEAEQQEIIDFLRERVRQLEEQLAPSDVFVPIEWALTPSEARLFSHLTTRELATKQSILMALYSDRIEDEPDPKIVDVFVCKIRTKLARHGVQIVTVWGQGYSLQDRHSFAAVLP